MSIIKSTNTGLRAIPITEESLGPHWSKETFLSEIVYTYKGKYGNSIKTYISDGIPIDNFLFTPFRGKNSIKIKNKYQLSLIEHYFECDDVKEMLEILNEICQS